MYPRKYVTCQFSYLYIIYHINLLLNSSFHFLLKYFEVFIEIHWNKHITCTILLQSTPEVCVELLQVF